MTTVENFVKLIENSDRVRILKDDKEIFVGYLHSLTMDEQNKYDDIRNCEMKKFRAVPEIRHKQWEQKGLMQPMMLKETEEYRFSDLQMSLYYTIHI